MNEMKERAFALLNSWTTCDTSLIAGDLDPEYTEYDRPQPEIKGLAALNDKLVAYHNVHANVGLKVLKQIVADDIVVSQWLLTCTVKRPEAGENGNRTLVQPGISWIYFANGKIVRHRIYRDLVGYLMQRGYRWTDGAATASATPANTPLQPEKELQS